MHHSPIDAVPPVAGSTVNGSGQNTGETHGGQRLPSVVSPFNIEQRSYSQIAARGCQARTTCRPRAGVVRGCSRSQQRAILWPETLGSNRLPRVAPAFSLVEYRHFERVSRKKPKFDLYTRCGACATGKGRFLRDDVPARWTGRPGAEMRSRNDSPRWLAIQSECDQSRAKPCLVYVSRRSRETATKQDQSAKIRRGG